MWAEDPIFALYDSPRGAERAGWKLALQPLDPFAAGPEGRHRRDAR